MTDLDPNPAIGPLATVNPDAVSRVFAANPDELSDAALDLLVLEIRRRRNVFLAKEAVKAATPKAKRAKFDAPGSEEAAALDVPPEEFKLDLGETP